MSNKLYDFLNKLQRWMPALTALYIGIAEIWHLGYTSEISKTLAVVGTFLAATLEIANSSYNKTDVHDDASIK